MKATTKRYTAFLNLTIASELIRLLQNLNVIQKNIQNILYLNYNTNIKYELMFTSIKISLSNFI